MKVLMTSLLVLVVDVKATDSWLSHSSVCGISEGGAFHDNNGDFIHLSR